VWRDWVLVGVLLPTIVLEGALRPDLTSRVFSTVVVAGLALTLLWRRTQPLLMVAIAFGLAAAALLVNDAPLQLHSMAFLIILPYALFRWGSGREAVIGMAIILANDLFSWNWHYPGAGDAIAGFAVLSLAAALGAALRYRARARLRELDQVKLVERERLARDLHDTIAHHVSAIAIRAQAGLATAATRPEAAGEALRVIELEASRALAEMRGLVRMLRRDEPAQWAPAPRIADLEQLAGSARGGPPVDVAIAGDVEDLPATVAGAIYRLAQESVTNARRHARHATRIEVRVQADDRAVSLRVSDDGDPADAGTPASPGYGLIGMIERTELLGGTFEAGPAVGRGWTVTAVVPR
jgi:signal transduction histidine kinase